MRFLHTSDWHLGRSLHGASLQAAQQAFCDHLIQTAEAEQVDAVLVSGDVYDRAIPPQWAVDLLSDTLVRLRRAGAQVVVSAGNHDSASRLGFAAGVLEMGGVHVRTSLDRITEPVPIGGVEVYPLPYLDPGFVGPRWQQRATHEAVVGEAVRRIDEARAARPPAPAVLMAHLFMANCAASDSERDVSVGDLGVVSRDVVNGFDYVALGHLHRAQAVSDTVRYCGAPLALAFDEVGHQQKVHLIVDLSEHAAAPTVREVEIPTWRRMSRVTAAFDQLLVDPAFSGAQDDWCEITLTDAVPVPGAMDRLRERFPHCLRLLRQDRAPQDDLRTYSQRVRGRSILELCCDFIESERDGAVATDRERALLGEAIAAVESCSEASVTASGQGGPEVDAAAGEMNSRGVA
ncbi:exonuclease SbcCD subunit D [Dermacoccaceae bacterium W4C1]